MATIGAIGSAIGEAAPEVRRIHTADLDWALAEGWRDFKARRGDFLMLPLIYPLAGFAAAALALDKSFLPVLFPSVAGLSILGPAVASGFYELARRREAGLESGWEHFVDPLRGRGRGSIAILTLGLVILFAAWLAAAAVLFKLTIGAAGSLDLGAFVRAVLFTRSGWTMIVVGNLVGFGFAVMTLALTLVSFPMVVDRPVGAGAAVMTSLRAVGLNPTISAIWGLRVAGLLALGCAPLFLGLPIILPILGYATWHLYTRLVDRSAGR
jgi:uncharacterized membrane protein